jgi:EAL domain-containing protein (putative c-di-GMP-specific phosphodiesterase class I)
MTGHPNVLEDMQAETQPRTREPLAVALEEVWRGIEEDQFLPYFQPKVSLRGMDLAGVEALMRWQHPQHGLLSAGTFLPLIADNFLFDELGAIMLEKSAAQCRAWQRDGLQVPVSLNLSPELLRDAALVEQLADKVRTYGLAAHRFIIEVSEVSVARDVAQALDTLVTLRAAGFGLALDDFGTGGIDLQWLAQIPASEVKIDRAMLAGAVRQPAVRRSLERAVQSARMLKSHAVAEGVETREEWDLVSALGCDMAQGYFIARPMPGDGLRAWLEAWTADPFV